MPVTLPTSPNATTPLNTLRWGLSLDSAGVDPNVNSVGYQLYKSGDVAVSELEQIPYTGKEQFVDFAAFVESFVSTPVPTPKASLAAAIAGFSETFYLKYGQIVFNTSTCINDTSGVNMDSANVAVVNARSQFFEDIDVFNSGDLVVITDLPATSDIAANQDNFIYIFRKSGGVWVDYTVTNSDGTTELDSQLIASLTNQAAGFSVGPTNLPFVHSGKPIVSIKIDVYDDAAKITPVKSFTQFIVPNCGIGAALHVYFEEPKGGFSVLAFDNVAHGGGVSANRYFQGIPSGATPTQAATTYGTTRYNVRNFHSFQFSRIIPFRPGLDQYLDGLLSSRNHFVLWNVGGAERLVKLDLSDGGYNTTGNGDFEFSIVANSHYPIIGT